MLCWAHHKLLASPDAKAVLATKDTGWRLALFRNPRGERDRSLLKIESASSLLFLWFLLRIGCKNFIDGVSFLVSLQGGCWFGGPSEYRCVARGVCEERGNFYFSISGIGGSRKGACL